MNAGPTDANPLRCPVPGCGARIFAGLLMCRRHWHGVPRRTREEVMRTWRALRRDKDGARPAYALARAAALDAAKSLARHGRGGRT